jgi:four helix bundle protein
MGREIQERGYRFGRDVMRYAIACDTLSVIGRELLRQLFRSAGSVGANLQEAHAAVSRRDFVHKVGLARKEAFEARHWLRLRRDMCPDDPALEPLQQEADELCRVLTAIVLSAKKNDSRPPDQ